MDLAEISRIRTTEPARIAKAWAERRRRPLVGDDGRMLLVAADHPARGALGVRGDTGAMASRSELLQQLWSDEPPASDALRSHLYTLRQNLGEHQHLVKTVHGVGVRLDVPDDGGG